MSVDELLDTLPNIVRTSAQVDQFLHEWVQMLHDRGASWQRIGMTLGVSRQAAWERFHRKPDLTQEEISG
jgi:ATP-dependent Clp protease ATP-binding subunit ClpX